MTGKEELQNQLQILNELAEANMCRMSDTTMRMMAMGIKSIIGKEFSIRYSREDVARFFGVSLRTLERWALKYSDFPKPRHYGTKEVSFIAEDVMEWKEKHGK